MFMNKVGIYFAFWTHDWTADYMLYLDKVSRLGFDILEVGSGAVLEMPKHKQRDLKKAAQDKGVELTYCIGFTADKDMASEDETVRRNGIEYAKKTIEMIGFMEGKVFGGINYSSWPGVLNEGIRDKRPYLDRSIAGIKEVIKTAEDCGVLYCLEVVNRFEQYLINTAAEGVAYIDEVGSPNLKLLLDVFHMNIEEDDMTQAIITAGDKLGHFHIGETNRRPPGQGRMPWKEIFGALKSIGYSGRIVMEPFVMMGGEVGRDIKVWRELNPEKSEELLDAQAKEALSFVRSMI